MLQNNESFPLLPLLASVAAKSIFLPISPVGSVWSYPTAVPVSVLQFPACRFCKGGGQIRWGRHQGRLFIDRRSGKIGKSTSSISRSLTAPNARAVSAVTGAFVNDDPVCLQATGFVLNPEGRVVTAVYSTRAIGRLMPDDVLGFVRHLKSLAKD